MWRRGVVETDEIIGE